MEELRRLWGRNVSLTRRSRNHRGVARSDGEHPMSQTRLAELCGVTQQTISSIERGEWAPRDDLKVKLGEALDQDVRVLFPLTRAVA